MTALALLIVAFLSAIASCISFGIPSRTCSLSIRRTSSLTMEYVPEGFSKAQWEAMKKKEQDQGKGKNLGAVGITKFKSRSFEAFQKSGAKNLFPVAPDTPLEERPYMMRPGGKPDASDLYAKGLKPRGLAIPAKIIDVDAKYDKLEKEGKLVSSPWAANMPWTNSGASSYKTPLAQEKAKQAAAEAAAAAAKAKTSKAVSGKAVPGKASPVKGKQTAVPAAPAAEPRKKLFGLF